MSGGASVPGGPGSIAGTAVVEVALLLLLLASGGNVVSVTLVSVGTVVETGVVVDVVLVVVDEPAVGATAATCVF